MARIETLPLLRARLGLLVRRPWVLVLLLAADLVELGLSLALAAAHAPAGPSRLAYAAWEAPFRAPEPSALAAPLGVALGVWVGATLLVELAWAVRLYRLRRARVAPRVRAMARVRG